MAIKRLSSPQVFVSPTAPTAPKANDVWVDSDEPFVVSAGGFVAQPDAPADTGVLWYDTDDTGAIVAEGNATSLGGYGLTDILKAIYPVGGVFVSGTNTMPSIVANIGTWVRLKQRVVVGVDEAVTEFNTVDKIGGSILHGHNAYLELAGGGVTVPAGRITLSANYYGSGATNKNAGYISQEASNSDSSLQPYKTKFMWERTA